MSFWSRGRRHREPAPPPDKPVVNLLGVVEFWTDDQRLTVGVDLSLGRLTDLLNREDSIRVVVLDPPPEDPSHPVEMRPDQTWDDLAVDDALLVFPPPQITDSQRRLHRPRQPIEILIGPFEVTGVVHIPPGAQAPGFLLRQNARFTAVTRAAVRDTRLDDFDQRVDVVLVNLRRIETIRGVGIGESEVADEPEAPEVAAGLHDVDSETVESPDVTAPRA